MHYFLTQPQTGKSGKEKTPLGECHRSRLRSFSLEGRCDLCQEGQSITWPHSDKLLVQVEQANADRKREAI